MKNKKISLNPLWLYVCVVLSILPAGCRTVKEAAGEANAALKAETEFFRTLDEQSLRYRTLSAKIQVEFTPASGKEVGSRAQLKLRRDDRLQISVQPLLGIEMFRLEVSRDSVKAIDRMNKRYFAESIADLKARKHLDFTFDNLQALLTNRLFLPGKQVVTPDDRGRFGWERIPAGYRLQTSDATGMQYRFLADNEAKLRTTEITDADKHTLMWDYTNFRTVEGQLFPMDMLASLRDHKLSIRFNKVEINTPVDLKFIIPEGYERVTPEQILKALSQ